MGTLTEATSKLRGRYAEGLPAKWRVVEEALAQLRNGDSDAKDTLIRVAHQVRGSAASFGFLLIDKAASRVEFAPDRATLDRATLGFIRALRIAYEAESTPTTRVLLIDDDPGIGFVMTALLGDEKLRITQVTTAAAAQEELETGSWNLVFVDLVLPDADGRSLLTQIRTAPLHRETPVVVLSAKTSSLVKNECAVYGIDDFIEKPIDPATFAGRVAATLERARTHAPVSYRDELTGLPNRLGFRRALDELPAHVRKVLTLAVIEVEHFERYVEEFGRVAGERALVLVSELLYRAIRSDDLLGRWGGAEFLVALPGLSSFDAINQLGIASRALRERELGGDLGPPLSISAGVTELDQNEQLDYALLRADQLLHRAKRSGDDQWYAETLEGTGGDRPRILMAEDDPAIASLLLRDLSDDFDITYVPDGQAAMEAAVAGNFDLVLLDYQMPRRDGVEVVKSLRAMPEYHDKPILLLTAVGSDAAVEAAFEAGADDYINKPHRRRALLARLSRHLGRSSATSPPTRDPEPRSEAVETEVTTVFCDISGFTRLTEALSPREVLDLLNSYFPLVSGIVSRHGGTLEKYIGDAVLAVWGAPRATDDDVVRAVEAAVAIQVAVAEFGQRYTPPLHVHIGVHSGPVIAATIGGEDRLQFATVGHTTNVASRVCDLARPGEVVLSEATVRALGERMRWNFEGPEAASLDGCEESMEVYRLSRAPT